MVQSFDFTRKTKNSKTMKNYLALSFAVCSSAASWAMPVPSPAETNRFNRLFVEGRTFAESGEVRFAGNAFTKVTDSTAFQDICKMGTLAIPLLAEKLIAEGKDKAQNAATPLTITLFCMHLWTETTRTSRFSNENPWAGDPIEIIWKGGKQLAQTRVQFLLSEMRRARQDGRNEDFTRAKTALVGQGIFSVEPLFDALESGDKDVVPVLTEFSWIKDECPDADSEQLIAWWSENKERFSLPERENGFEVNPRLEKWKRLGK